MAGLLVAGLLLGLGLLNLPNGLSSLAYFFIMVPVLATAVAPRDLDMGLSDYSHLAHYNRWGWAG